MTHHAVPDARPELAAARDTIATLMSRHHVPGLSIAVTGPDELLYAEGFGYRDLMSRQPATPTTSYLWFSLSKIATATAALRLADDGSLDLEAPVHTLVPGFTAPPGAPQPLVRHLLDHTSGAGRPLPVRWVLPADRTSEDAAAVTAALLRRHGRPGRPPGGPARYSNVGYLVLAEVVSRVSGQPFEEHVRQAVLEPAGMTGTGYTLPGGDVATGYIRLPRPLTPLLRAALPSGIVGRRQGDFVALQPFRVAGAGYGGLIGSATDAARLLRLHLADGVIDGHRVLAPRTARRMREIRTPGRPFDLGLGWFRRPADRDATPGFVEHWGTGGGFWNAMRLYPDAGLGIVVMANTTRPYEHDALLRAMAAAFLR